MGGVTLVRVAFFAALAVLVVGMVAIRAVVAPLFVSGANPPSPPVSALVSKGHPHRSPTAIPSKPHAAVRRVRKKSRSVKPAEAPSPRPTPIAKTPATVTPTSIPTATITPTTLPTPSPTAGIVTLTRYWVGSPQARTGTTISVGYVIDNATGRTERISLGASLKSSRVLSWGRSLSDPAHDVTATVPPGISTHIRFFTLPAGLRPGAYDIAWGLRNAVSGERVALVAAGGSLTVER